MTDPTEFFWFDSCRRIKIPQAEAGLMWTEFQGRYAEPHRYYHTMAHVSSMLELLAEHRPELLAPDVVVLAAFFHDVIYDPRANDNEARSADFGCAWLSRLGVAEQVTTIVRELILATAAHMDAPGIGDVAWFLDADLAILGAPSAEYDAYAASIRREYSFVPAGQYHAGRSRIIQTFLSSSQLYRNRVFAERFDDRARTNLQRELAALR